MSRTHQRQRREPGRSGARPRYASSPDNRGPHHARSTAEVHEGEGPGLHPDRAPRRHHHHRHPRRHRHPGLPQPAQEGRRRLAEVGPEERRDVRGDLHHRQPVCTGFDTPARPRPRRRTSRPLASRSRPATRSEVAGTLVGLLPSAANSGSTGGAGNTSSTTRPVAGSGGAAERPRPARVRCNAVPAANWQALEPRGRFMRNGGRVIDSARSTCPVAVCRFSILRPHRQPVTSLEKNMPSQAQETSSVGRRFSDKRRHAPGQAGAEQRNSTSDLPQENIMLARSAEVHEGEGPGLHPDRAPRRHHHHRHPRRHRHPGLPQPAQEGRRRVPQERPPNAATSAETYATDYPTMARLLNRGPTRDGGDIKSNIDSQPASRLAQQHG